MAVYLLQGRARRVPLWRILHLLAASYADMEQPQRDMAVLTWLDTPQKGLQGQRPIDVLMRGDGKTILDFIQGAQGKEAQHGH